MATVIENLEDLSIDDVIEQFDVTREQVMAVLDFVAESLRADPSRPVLILCDHGTPKGLARALSGHTVHTAQAAVAVPARQEDEHLAVLYRTRRGWQGASIHERVRSGAQSSVILADTL